ncbi:D-3-phosphoglycerate dehydrogenase [Arboricoccus pini]|uniref:D-3-phosphoglycerate dehydrogenase n=1 Tax=Arboricoccus pini TaxID=1963835 RepID=A0A212RUQ9_9PROT|nr:phosphoglycerate dehydrogenase [Arboricoccus pini]SNB76409.1 D-3-phosphoglycerate dehydrogenase [Arboricoccus pini]
MSWRIVVLDPLSESRLLTMRRLLPAGFELAAASSPAPEDQARAIAHADFAIAGDMPLTADLLAQAPRLRAVHKWGVGVDNFDLEAAARRSIRVLRTTGSNAGPVAETALGLMLALLRQISAGDRGMRAGHWAKADLAPRSFTLGSRTVGLVGLGAIGGRLATLLQGFGCRLLYAKPKPLPEARAEALHLTHVPLETLLATSDIISLHCPLTPATRRLIDAAALSRVKEGALLINTARGDLVDEAALLAALVEGRLGGAGLDVFSEEPLPSLHPLASAPNVILTPHIGASAVDNLVPTLERMFRNLACVAEGRAVDPGDVVI